MKPKFDVLWAYFEEKGYSLEPGKFYDYYEAKDWKANGKDIINWKALVDTWAKNKSINEKKTEVKPAGAKKEQEKFSTVMERGLQTAAEAAAGIQNAEFRPVPDPDVCRYCPYDRFCKSAVKSSRGGA